MKGFYFTFELSDALVVRFHLRNEASVCLVDWKLGDLQLLVKRLPLALQFVDALFERRVVLSIALRSRVAVHVMDLLR